MRNIMFAKDHGDINIEHNILPSHIECDSKPILEWIKKNLSDFQLRISGYHDPKKISGEHSEIARRITIKEYDYVVNHARKIGLDI